MKKNKKYALNLDTFFELITKKNTNEKNTDCTITEIWQPNSTRNNELILEHKEIIDNKYDTNNNLCGVRYDFLNNIINEIIRTQMLPDGKTFIDEEQMTFGQKIIFNTLLKEGVIYEIKDDAIE